MKVKQYIKDFLTRKALRYLRSQAKDSNYIKYAIRI